VACVIQRVTKARRLVLRAQRHATATWLYSLLAMTATLRQGPEGQKRERCDTTFSLHELVLSMKLECCLAWLVVRISFAPPS